MEQDTLNNEGYDKIIEINKIFSANLFDLAPDFATPENRHEYWEFVYVNSGIILSTSRGKTVEMCQGQMIFNRPDTVHTSVCNGKSGAVIFSMIFDCPSLALDIFDRLCLTVPQNAMIILKNLIDECEKTYNVSVFPLSRRNNAPFGGEQLIKSYLEALLLLLIRKKKENDIRISEQAEKSEKKLPETRKSSLSEEICEFLSSHLYERGTLDQLSEHFHFGKVYLCDIFKKNMGTTIIGYHTDLKITEAKRLLRETDATVTEIADKLGFASPSYFTRCFKGRTGYPPKSFRKMLITNAAVKR